MNERDLDLERQLRAWYRREIDDDLPTPTRLVQDVRSIPRNIGDIARHHDRRRGLTLLAAAAVLAVAGGVVLIGTGQHAVVPFPSARTTAAPSLAAEPSPVVQPSPAVRSSAPPTSVTAPSIAPAVTVSGGATWQPAGTMSTPREVPTATLLLDGRVLVTGGTNVDSPALASAEVWDPATRTFTPTGSMHVGRVGHAATLLHDGRVLVVGGDEQRDALTDLEVWDPATGEFTMVATSPDRRRSGLTATTLADGRVLIVGGVDCPRNFVTNKPSICLDPNPDATLLWDPESNALSSGGDLHLDRDWHSATHLPDGRVFIVGGTGEVAGQPESAEVWDPVTGRFQVVGEPIDYRAGVMSSTLLPDGHVLIVGGYTGSLTRNDAWDGPLGTAELWDPATGMFSRAGKMHHIRVGHQAALLGDGRVLVVGGTGAATKDFVNVGLRSSELWDPTTMTFSPGPAMVEGRRGFTLTTLADGSLLAIGGEARNDRGESTEVRDTAEILGAPTR